MVYDMEFSGTYGKPPRNIFQRRAYAATRALIAIDRYSALASAEKSEEQKQRALRWMRAWMAFAVSYSENACDTSNRAISHRRA